MATRKKAKSTKEAQAPTPTAPSDPLSIPEEAIELEELADALWMIRCGLDINENRDRIDTALGAIERGIRRVGDSVGDNLAAMRTVLKQAVK